MTAQTATDLRAVRAHLVEHGWTQGRAHDEAGRCCLVGAATRAMGDVVSYRYGAVRSALFMALRGVDFDLSAWNDAPGRTFAEVLALLDAAIANEEGRP